MTKKDTVTISKDSLWKVGTFVFGILFVISLFTGGFGTGDNPGSGNIAAPTPSAQPSIPTGIPSVNAEELAGDSPFMGKENAEVTIVEFSDFQCPFCKRARDDAVKQIEEQYVETGKVKFVYKHFPLTSIHPLAQPAAEASECAYDQDKFWEYHDKIFENQAMLSMDNLKKWASDLGLDTDEFNDCLDSGKHTAKVNKDLQDAQNAGGRGTPFFVVGSTPLSGAQPFANFQQIIEAELNK